MDLEQAEFGVAFDDPVAPPDEEEPSVVLRYTGLSKLMVWRDLYQQNLR